VKVIIFEKNCEMTMELLDGEPMQANPEEQAEWFSYVKKYANPGTTDENTDSACSTNPSFLKRNRRKPITEEPKVEPDATLTQPTETETEEQPVVDPNAFELKRSQTSR
jgi:hypothetical protein